MPELYIKFTRFLINSMKNLDILSRAYKDDRTPDEIDIKLPSWVPPFHRMGTTSLIDDNRYDAAGHMGSYHERKSKCSFLTGRLNKLTSEVKGDRVETSELPVEAIFLGKITQKSHYVAPADSMGKCIHTSALIHRVSNEK